MMKQRKKELVVDTIGGAGHLTAEEEQAISEFIKTSKQRKQRQAARQMKRTAKSKATSARIR